MGDGLPARRFGTGNYRMAVRFSRSDILHLFKSVFGAELDVSLLNDHGFTVSPELKRSILQTVKLTDLTLADLSGMNSGSPSNAQQPSQSETRKPLLRTV